MNLLIHVYIFNSLFVCNEMLSKCKVEQRMFTPYKGGNSSKTWRRETIKSCSPYISKSILTAFDDSLSYE